MKKVKVFTLAFIMLFMSFASFAQVNVKGTVLSSDGEPVIGAAVLQSGTNNGTVTDMDGKFSISVPSGTSLEFSSVGFVTTVLKATPQMDVVLEIDNKLLDEVVVTGYMAEKKADLTGAITVVKMEGLNDTPTIDPMSLLQGRVAGVQVSTTGSPGASASMKIRGTTSINSTSPLYVVDGVVVSNMSSIVTSNDIESIQILKDAASAAIYGAQAAAGVVLITTKRAKNGEIKVDFTSSVTSQHFASAYDLLNTEEYGQVYWQAYYNTYGKYPSSKIYGSGEKPVVQEYYYDVDGVKIRVADTDWQKEMYQTALMQNYNLNLSKGGNNHISSLSVNYSDQKGLVRNSDHKQLTTRIMNEFSFLDNKLKVGETASISRIVSHSAPGGIHEQLVAQMPQIPVYDENGGYAGGYTDILNDKPNPIRLSDNEANNLHETWRVFGNAYAEIRPIQDLVIRTNFAVNYSSSETGTFTPKWQEASRVVADNAYSRSHSLGFNYVSTTTATYSKEFGKNSITALLGYEAKHNHSETMTGSGAGIEIEDLNYVLLSTVTTNQIVSGSRSDYAMVSQFGKLNYNYDERYLLSATIRRDASSRFGANNNAAIFPSVSVGWRVSQESFMQNTKDWLNSLKLRASWGINGNDSINNNATYNIYKTSLDDSYNMNGDGVSLYPSAIRSSLGNPYLRWEQTTQFNLGFDASFFRNKLDVSFDWFNKDTDDMLQQPGYAGVIGEGGSSYQNCAAMNNKGVELSFTWRDNVGDFSYQLNGNLSFYKNKITNIPEDTWYTFGCGNGVDITNVGLPYGSKLGMPTDGLFRTQAEVDEYKSKYDVQYGVPQVGHIKYVDANNDKIISTADRIVIGDENPRVEGGLNVVFGWKGFTFDMFWSGRVKQAYNSAKYYTDLFYGWTGNHSTRLLDAMYAWDEYLKTGVYDCEYPALAINNKNRESTTNSWFMEDGSYLKLKTVTLGYTVPNSILKKIHVRNMRVYLQGQNLLTFTKYTGPDPELTGYSYPIPRSFTLGLNIGL